MKGGDQMGENRIRERREKLRMTQAELAEKSGISRQTISALESGDKVDVKVSTIKALADALKCKPTFLFG